MNPKNKLILDVVSMRDGKDLMKMKSARPYLGGSMPVTPMEEPMAQIDPETGKPVKKKKKKKSELDDLLDFTEADSPQSVTATN